MMLIDRFWWGKEYIVAEWTIEEVLHVQKNSAEGFKFGGPNGLVSISNVI